MDHTATILYAEDDLVLAGALADVLSDVGYDTLHAPDGEVALYMASRSSPDLLLTDLEMPRMGGLELVAQLRRGNPSLPVVVLSGSVPEAGILAFAGMGDGPLVLISKPATMAQVLGAVDQALGLAVAPPAAWMAA